MSEWRTDREQADDARSEPWLVTEGIVIGGLIASGFISAMFAILKLLMR